MKITIDQQIIERYGLTVDEFLYIVIIAFKADLFKASKSLHKKGLTATYPTEWNAPWNEQPTKQAFLIHDDILVDADTSLTPEDQLKPLAEALIDIYPKGMKENKWPWTEGVDLVIRRLRLFEKKYGKYPDDEIIAMTRKYVELFNGKPEMRLLKYFIFKEKESSSGIRESVSDLYTMLENKEDYV